MDTDYWSSEDECDVVEDFQVDSSNLWLWVLGAIALLVFFFLSYQTESSGSSSDVFVYGHYVDDDDKNAEYAGYAEYRNPNDPKVPEGEGVRFANVNPSQFAPYQQAPTRRYDRSKSRREKHKEEYKRVSRGRHR